MGMTIAEKIIAAAAEILAANNKIPRPDLLWKVRVERFKCMFLHFLQIRQKQILGGNDLIGVKIVMKFENRSLFHSVILSDTSILNVNIIAQAMI